MWEENVIRWLCGENVEAQNKLRARILNKH